MEIDFVIFCIVLVLVDSSKEKKEVNFTSPHFLFLDSLQMWAVKMLSHQFLTVSHYTFFQTDWKKWEIFFLLVSVFRKKFCWWNVESVNHVGKNVLKSHEFFLRNPRNFLLFSSTWFTREIYKFSEFLHLRRHIILKMNVKLLENLEIFFLSPCSIEYSNFIQMRGKHENVSNIFHVGKFEKSQSFSWLSMSTIPGKKLDLTTFIL